MSRNVECCCQCGWPKIGSNLSDEAQYLGWPACSNPDCENYALATSNAWYRSPEDLRDSNVPGYQTLSRK